ncbi:Sds3-like-domain-containing protein [Mycotypha africana]|uniref:Sds3-like-domain-containing protein n=1 Tax=Mycotypha africana TaxID=64632 RepID=UPI0022FFDEA9|nr:Sds3-like-domain-containing protein [Mycotypha africana]KAI8981876.1 Sds3-like-domain-containing protein [Mycotypha africana]
MYYPPNTPEKNPVITRRAESPERFTLPPISSTSHIPTPLPSIAQQQRSLETGFYAFLSASATTAKAANPPPPPPPPPPAATTTNSSYSYAPSYMNKHNTATTYNHTSNTARTPKQQAKHQQPQYKEYDYYSKPEWPMVEDNPKQRKKREIDERLKTINQEFLDTKEDLYEEKLKDLQDELLAVEDGRHQFYTECLADLEQQRQKTINDAKLMMVYQISCVDHEFELTSKKVHEECMRERQDLQNAMFTLVNEKRKKLKEEKHGEGPFAKLLKLLYP